MWRIKGLFTYIQATNFRSFVLFAYFAGCLFVLWLPFLMLLRLAAPSLGLYGLYQQPLFSSYVQTLPIPLLFAVAWLCFGMYFHMGLIRRATGAREVTRNDEPRLYNTVENLAIAAGLPMPRVELIDTSAMNAFAYGLNQSDAAVAVTRGLLQRLNDRELQAVVAHELMHVKNKDVQVNVVASILMGLVSRQASLIWERLTRHETPLHVLFHAHPQNEDPATTGSTQRRRLLAFIAFHIAPLIGVPIVVAAIAAGAIPLWLCGVGLVALIVWYRSRDEIRYSPSKKWLIVFPIWTAQYFGGFLAGLAYLLAAVTTGRILRSREFLADAGAVELTKDAQALCSALAIVSGRDRLANVDDATMALMISGSSGGWLATHPTVEKRIAALQVVARDLFDRLPPEPVAARARTAARPDLLRVPAASHHQPAAGPTPTFGRRTRSLPISAL